MYKAVFQNSKIALIFAVMTIFSAVSMVGTSDDAGLLTKIASLSARSDSAADSGAQQPSGEARSKPSIFGQYNAGSDAGKDAQPPSDVPRPDEPLHLK